VTLDEHVKIKLAVGDLPKGEAEYMARTGFSPCCHASLIPGPRGGLSTNCWCDKCHGRFNVIFGLPDIDWGQCTSTKDDEGLEQYKTRRRPH
jgi:hypothetical protein